ncbi:hypothetical protein ASG87_15130 [Frateuria sp. Soil773]|uniref:DUF4861 family protein n=1 Tax=Frateuria sp. Soil773 TaxID=1736407 RepID=UPI0006FE227C|nr:DUF4861 family protein [Frateuria sp. Soil773]KRE97854.1 hypothetical protein ASG87_15130 [Frateuria sp. Soil773]
MPAASAVRPATAAATGPLWIEVANTLPIRRPGEVLEVPLAELFRRRPAWRGCRLAARVDGSDRLVPVQRYADDGGMPDTLLVQLDMAPRASVRLAIEPAADDAAPTPNPLHARKVPERDDDFAWENAQVTYRIYGPGLQAKGEVSSGIDVWSKRPPHRVIEDWYRRDRESQRRGDPSLSYHVDNGVGLDSYAVGHSPGAGGTAAWKDGKPAYSANPARVLVTATGPIRLRFEVDYAPWKAGAVFVREHKAVTLDAGSHMNRQAVSYRLEGARRLTLAAGVSVHDGARVAHEGAASIAVWDTPQKADAGRIATALIVAPKEPARYAEGGGAAWALFDVGDGDTVRFASGAGWSKGDMPDFAAWQRYLGDYRQRWANPLRLRWLDR